MLRAILPGRPQSKLQALSTAHWHGLRVVAYISGNALIILKGPQEILQTIYVDDASSLESIAIEETSGRIAVCGQKYVHVYSPTGRDEGVLKWSQIQSLATDNPRAALEHANTASTLSWGSSDELLVGSSQLTLWNIPESEEATRIWTQKVANRVKLAHFSHDAGLIASCGQHDRLVKIWRRLSYELETTRFDISYLPHPTAVTNMHWRKPWHAEQNLDNLLYTFCADNKIRIWAHSDPHARSVMQYVAEIDMNASIQPRRLSVGSMSKRRYGFVLDSRDFSKATEKAVQNSSTSGVDHALENLVEIANRSPEICIILDGIGHMSAWGLENAGCKNKKPASIFNVAHVDGMNISFDSNPDPKEDYAQVVIFAGRMSDSTLSIVSHTFDGKIDWYDSHITELFDPSSRKDRARLVSTWTGHNDSVEQICRNETGQSVLSSTENGTGILWDCNNNRNDPPLSRRSNLPYHNGASQSRITVDGNFVVALNGRRMSIWDSRASNASLVAEIQCSPKNNQRCLVLSADAQCSALHFFATIVDEDGRVDVWKLHLSPDTGRPSDQTNGCHLPIEHIHHTKLNGLVDVIQILPIDRSSLLLGPGTIPKEVAIALTSAGLVHVIQCEILPDESKVVCNISTTIDVGVEKALAAQAVASGKLALAGSDGTEMAIWDLPHGWLEFEQEVPYNERIEKLAWMTTEQDQSVLAVGLQHRIAIFAQQRFTSRPEKDSWVLVREIRLREFTTHSLGDLCWLSGGSLLIGAGNQLFVQEQDVEMDKRMTMQLGSKVFTGKSAKLLQFVGQVSGSLAIFHPEYIHQLLSLGELGVVHRLLTVLHNKLRFWSEGDDIPSHLDLELDQVFSSISSEQASHKSRVDGADPEYEEEHLFTEDQAVAISEHLEKAELWQLSSSDYAQLAVLAKKVAQFHRHQTSVDANALRYLHFSNIFHHSNDRLDLPPVSYRDILFASRSTSQDILVDLLSRSAGGKLTWRHARASGLFLWLSDIDAARSQMEIIARNEYTSSGDRNPVDCSLYYFALRKKNVLQGLWRMSPGIKEQTNTLKLLANNFEEARWRTTALKNAYVLLSKRRFEYAAAFFLLGGSLKDAVNVCVHQLKDVQLAVAIARVNGGDDSPELRSLLVDRILPDAVERGDRWCATWVFSMLGLPEKAILALLRPLYSLLDGVALNKTASPDRETLQAKHWRNHEPGLAVMYRQLRAQLVRNGKGSSVGGITEKEEWDFVLRCAHQYVRMGCEWLALGLVRNWDFVPRQPIKVENAHATDEAAAEEEKVAGAKHEQKSNPKEVSAGKKESKPAPTQFEEPSANSLLDSFGF